MFISYNLEAFGDKLKELRRDLGYSQRDLERQSGISSDTLRRIEKGEVIPRYETLELLSSLYKEDLLELLKECRSHKMLTEYYDSLDDVITTYNDEKMRSLEKEIRDSFKDNKDLVFINPNEVIQLLLLIRGTALYHSRFESDKTDAKNILLDALRLTQPSFNITQFMTYKYTFIELRILLLYAILLAEEKELPLSTKILYFILERLKKGAPTAYQMFLMIKIYTNICYNYHLEDAHKKVLLVADEALAFCEEKETTHGLNSLYYRKGIAEYHLKSKNYMSSLFRSFFILKITGKEDLLAIYQKVTKEQYGIEIPMEY